MYTARAVSQSSEPMSLTIAPFNGFEIVSRSERTEVSLTGGPIRTTVLEIRLRALRPGRWQVGPARATQGSETTEAAAIVVEVEPSAAVAATALNPRLRSLLERTPPPPRGKAAVALVVSADTVRVGEQVDVVTAAWFPRDLRLQLRRPPTLQPPVIDGVWSYPQAAPSGHRRHPEHRRYRLRSVCRPPGGVPSGGRNHRDPARHAEVQHAARPPVLQPGGALCTDQPARDPDGAAAPDRGPSGGLQRRGRLGTAGGAPGHSSDRSPGRGRGRGAGAVRGRKLGALATSRDPMAPDRPRLRGPGR